MGQRLGCRCDGSELQWARVTLGIHALDLVLGFGTLHCRTQQQPAEWES